MLLTTAILLTTLAAEPVALPKLELPKDAPRLVDDRLKLELIADSEHLVTPTGLTIDRLGHVLVVECHTHFRPPNYQGPPADRILCFVDTNRDGIPDKRYIFFEGTTATMNVAAHPNGWIYVATRNEVFRLQDTDADNASDRRENLVKLETPGNYPHNGLSGFAFDAAGNVVFGMGENLGANYRLIGSDGSEFKGGGEGGNIFRCTADGKKVTRIATGFWNPFHVCYDVFGQLFTVDNDPDSRPPCRLLHVVEGGDYGYRFRNGRRGVHPFTAWNGELPGTLPMVAGTGEAPSGMLAYESDNLPEDYLGHLLVTSWGDHRIERYPLKGRGASFTSTMKPVVVGGDNFRPVGIATAHDGTLFFSDWVDKSYQLHGKGRLWRLSNATPKRPYRPTDPTAALASLDRRTREAGAAELLGGSGGARQLEEVRSSDSPLRMRAAAIAALGSRPLMKGSPADLLLSMESADLQALYIASPWFDAGHAMVLPANRQMELTYLAWSAGVRQGGLPLSDVETRGAMLSSDSFVRQAVRQRFAEDLKVNAAGTLRRVRAGLRADDPRQRVEFALIARQGFAEDRVASVRELLDDADPTVRFVAIRWAAEEGLVSDVQADLDRAVQKTDTTRELLEAYLVAITPRPNGQFDPKNEAKGEEFIAKLLVDPKTNPTLRRFALRSLRPDHPSLTFQLLDQYLADKDEGIQLEAVRSLREKSGPERDSRLLRIAKDDQAGEALRGEAVMGLTMENDTVSEVLRNLAANGKKGLATDALRTLRGAFSSEEYEAFSAMMARSRDKSEETDRLIELTAKSPEPQPAAPAASQTSDWLKLVGEGGNAEVGERVFFHLKAGSCTRCHAMNGRGGGLGPDLTQTASRLTRERLLQSILQPSLEIAPQFVPWQIVTTDGRNFTALLVNEEVDGTQIYRDAAGKTYRLKPLEIEERKPSEKSLMPEGLEKQMTREELRDLLAFLGKKTP